MVRGYIYEQVEGSLNYMHPVEAALYQIMTDFAVIGYQLEPTGTDLAKGSKGISFEAPSETAVGFNNAFTGSTLLASNLKLIWIDPLPTGRGSTPPSKPPPEPPPGELPAPLSTETPTATTLPMIDWGATWRKFAPYIVVGGGGFLLWLYLKRREEK